MGCFLEPYLLTNRSTAFVKIFTESGNSTLVKKLRLSTFSKLETFALINFQINYKSLALTPNLRSTKAIRSKSIWRISILLKPRLEGPLWRENGLPSMIKHLKLSLTMAKDTLLILDMMLWVHSLLILFNIKRQTLFLLHHTTPLILNAIVLWSDLFKTQAHQEQWARILLNVLLPNRSRVITLRLPVITMVPLTLPKLLNIMLQLNKLLRRLQFRLLIKP